MIEDTNLQKAARQQAGIFSMPEGLQLSRAQAIICHAAALS
jgi:hypothetical protein